MKTPNDSPEEESLKAPAKLLAALRQPAKKVIFVPPVMDEVVLRAARRHLAKNEAPRLRWFRLVPWLAASTAMMIAGLWLYLHAKPNSKTPRQPTFAREDVNHDGQVDILDAFLLAKRLQAGKLPNSGLDINGDGVIDGRDVETIVIHAVTLGRGGRS